MYASTENAETEVKEEFYEKTDEEMRRTLKEDAIILLGEDKVKKEYKSEIHKLVEEQINEEDIDTRWGKLKEAVNKAAEKVSGKEGKKNIKKNDTLTDAKVNLKKSGSKIKMDKNEQTRTQRKI
ncbi:hypothetical protein ILUMI_20658 [Ignelater luminosus]|uniref:Uncharacterized protein n=1 Tax=Ignelater luminosus TaxID=2038154 RepID=A0A8K0G4M9_IGNLU|nr:hypothetical protein ILUMI_20658 [Ignelater luminosus]